MSDKIATHRRTWCWRRRLAPERQDFWSAQLQAAGGASWAFMERPRRSRILLEVYFDARAEAAAWARRRGGRIHELHASVWAKPHSAAPTAVGRKLLIVHTKARSRKDRAVPQLHIPHGMAFGSGEHATTFMLLRALAAHGDWSKTTVLDLGTGSGVLALAARRFGARKIVGSDFDADAVRTARQNEALNFSRPLIGWRRADVRRLGPGGHYGLVLANLFSGILVEAAPQIVRCVAAEGKLWLSGILRSQAEEVIAAYEGQGMKLVRPVRRGKWVMLQLMRGPGKGSSLRRSGGPEDVRRLHLLLSQRAAG